MSSDINRPSLGQYVLLFVLAAVWGSSFILIKVGLFGWTGSPGTRPILSGVQLGFLRISLAGLVLLPFSPRSSTGSAQLAEK